MKAGVTRNFVNLDNSKVQIDSELVDINVGIYLFSLMGQES